MVMNGMLLVNFLIPVPMAIVKAGLMSSRH